MQLWNPNLTTKVYSKSQISYNSKNIAFFPYYCARKVYFFHTNSLTNTPSQQNPKFNQSILPAQISSKLCLCSYFLFQNGGSSITISLYCFPSILINKNRILKAKLRQGLHKSTQRIPLHANKKTIFNQNSHYPVTDLLKTQKSNFPQYTTYISKLPDL